MDFGRNMASQARVIHHMQMHADERLLLCGDMRHVQRLYDTTAEPFFLAESKRLIDILNNDIGIRPRVRPADSTPMR